jgi:hypothetical protein
MADEDENLVVNLDEDESEEDKEKKIAEPVAVAPAAKPPPVPGPSAAPAQGLAELQKQIATERAERARVTEQARQIAAERDQAIAFAQEAERRGVSTYELYTENQIKATEDKMIALSNAAEQAMQDGDFKRATACNLEVGRLGGDLGVLRRDHAILQQQREREQQRPQQQRQQPQRQQPQQPQPQIPTDPLERAIYGRTEPTKQFLRKHPDLVRGDGTLKKAAVDAHESALDAGYAADTPGYFEFIERTIMPTETSGQPPVPPASRGQAPTTAAPVARAGGPGGGAPGSNGTFTMTPKMRRLAEEQGVTPQEWARNYVRLLAEGRITPIT